MAQRIYSDLESAGGELAAALVKYCDSSPLVLAIANGGVPVAMPIADYLGAELDLLLIRRLFVREEVTLPISAVSVCGQLVIDADDRTLSDVESQFRQQAIEELAQRAMRMRGNNDSVTITGRNVVVVDNGIHTGSSFQIVVNSLRTLKPNSITIAVPVAATSIKKIIESLANEVVCLQWCEHFGNTAMWYKQFRRPDDEQITTMLQTGSRLLM